MVKMYGDNRGGHVPIEEVHNTLGTSKDSFKQNESKLDKDVLNRVQQKKVKAKQDVAEFDFNQAIDLLREEFYEAMDELRTELNLKLGSNPNPTFVETETETSRRKKSKKRYRQSNDGKARKKATDAIKKAIANGVVEKQPCKECGAAHNVWPDILKYSNPTYKLEWLCPTHYFEKQRASESNQ